MVDEDTQHLQLLSLFHYVLGGILGLFGCVPIFHLAFGIAVVAGAMDNGNPPPPAFGWMFIAMAVLIMAWSWAVAIAIAFAGRKIAARSAYTFCLVVAAIECTFMPLGTVLGVFTILVLIRPSVKQLFGVPIIK